jgi:hypothetical protein
MKTQTHGDNNNINHDVSDVVGDEDDDDAACMLMIIIQML